MVGLLGIIIKTKERANMRHSQAVDRAMQARRLRRKREQEEKARRKRIERAGPDLLRACQDVCNARDRAEPYGGPIFQQALDNVEHARDKAEGKL